MPADNKTLLQDIQVIISKGLEIRFSRDEKQDCMNILILDHVTKMGQTAQVVMKVPEHALLEILSTMGIRK